MPSHAACSNGPWQQGCPAVPHAPLHSHRSAPDRASTGRRDYSAQTMRNLKRLLVPAVGVSLAACGAVAGSGPGDAGSAHWADGRVTALPVLDAGHSPQGARDGGLAPGADSGRTPATDSGPSPATDGGVVHPDAGHDASSSLDSGPSPGVFVDAGLYRGDGSYFADGGGAARPDGGGHVVLDAGAVDASPGCAALAACCASVANGSQTLCKDVVAQGNAADCATELAQLQTSGDCTGVSVLASEGQVPANEMVSDGTTLFWTTSQTPGLLAMPTSGGPIRVVIEGPVGNDNTAGIPGDNGCFFLAVDGVNIYLLASNYTLVRIPKAGGNATLVSEPGGMVVNATSLGATAYWIESGNANSFVVESAPLLGGPVSQVGAFTSSSNPISNIAVTSTTLFVGGRFAPVLSAPLAGGSLTAVNAPGTAGMYAYMTSDTDAMYFGEADGSNLRIASDGAATTLGPTVSSSPIVFDDTYAYWADQTSPGSIMKAPKAGGGPATVLAQDTNPTAVAVDATSVYWSDEAGYIKSVPK